MKTMQEIISEMDASSKRRQHERDFLHRMVKEHGFIETGIWITGNNMRNFDLFNGYLPDQIYKVMKNSFTDSFTFYAHYSPTEDAFFDIEYYENSKWIDVDGMVAMPVFIHYKILGEWI